MNRVANSLICSTAADVAGHCSINIRVSRFWLLCEQRACGIRPCQPARAVCVRFDCLPHAQRDRPQGFSRLPEADRRLLAEREWFSDRYTVLDPYGFVFYTWGVRRQLPMGELKNYTAFKNGMLKSNGLLVFHVSNRYMDVEGLISAVVTDASLAALARHDDAQQTQLKARSHYVIAAKDAASFGSLQHDENWLMVRKPEGIDPWTDDYSNMLEILRWR